MRKVIVTPEGIMVELPDIDGMFAPYQCGRCGHVHDAGNVEVKARYVDCDVWDCPKCGRRIDNRQFVSLVTAIDLRAQRQRLERQP